MSGDATASPIEITFYATGNSVRYTLGGWSKPEPQGSWTVGTESRLRVDGIAPNVRYHLAANLGPFLAPPRLTHQDLSVVVNGTEVWSERFTGNGKIDCVIPAYAIGSSGSVDIVFRCPTAKAPKELGPSDDDRQLGFGVWNLTLTADAAGGCPSARRTATPDASQRALVEAPSRQCGTPICAAISLEIKALEISFAQGGNGHEFLSRGWYKSEPQGTWTDGPESCLRLPSPGGSAGYQCRLYLTPFVAPPQLNEQELIISVSGREVFHSGISKGGGYDFEIPRELIGSLPSFDLLITCPNNGSPLEFGAGEDPRRLGVYLGTLILTPLTKAPDISEFQLPAQPTRPVKVAAVTMAYNEPEYLPIWLRHYAKHVGIENCFIIDHGSTDRSTTNLGACSVLRIPRSPYDPHQQSAFNSTFCSSLLTWYDWIVYSDVDELILPDPRVTPTLADYCRLPLPDVVTAIGLNVQHLPDAEPPLDLRRPVTTQRSFVFACSPMCKPLLTRRPIVWCPGSHSADAPTVFDNLYVFHLRWFDLTIGLARLQRTRAMEWGRLDAGAQARLRDEELEEQFRGFARLPRITDMDFNPAEQPMREFLDKVQASRLGREHDLYKIDLDIWWNRLWKIPQRFIGAF